MVKVRAGFAYAHQSVVLHVKRSWAVGATQSLHCEATHVTSPSSSTLVVPSHAAES